jgi:HopA1 effector protein family
MSVSAVNEILTEILTGLVIQKDFTISHPHHPDFTAPELVINRVQMSTPDIQTKFLVQHLQSYLTGTYFNQLYRQPSDVSDVFANDTAALLSRIQAANSSRGYYDWHWLVEEVIEDEVVVIKDGLRLYMPTNCVHVPHDNLVKGELVAISMPKNIWTTERYVAIGNYGRLPIAPITNIYWNCSSDTAIGVIQQLTTDLNQLQVPFELQVEPEIDAYHRLEPLILGLLRSDYLKAEPLLRQIYDQYSWRLDTLPFAKKLAPGLAVAETVSPANDFATFVCRLIARAIIKCPENSLVVTQIAAIWQEFVENGVVGNKLHLISEENIYSEWVN